MNNHLFRRSLNRTTNNSSDKKARDSNFIHLILENNFSHPCYSNHTVFSSSFIYVSLSNTKWFLKFPIPNFLSFHHNDSENKLTIWCYLSFILIPVSKIFIFGTIWAKILYWFKLKCYTSRVLLQRHILIVNYYVKNSVKNSQWEKKCFQKNSLFWHLIHILPWRQQKHQCLCFHYWHYIWLTFDAITDDP